MSASDLNPTPLSKLRISKHQIPAHDLIPNSSLQSKPLIIYHSAFSPTDASAEQIESHLLKIGVVTPQWRYTIRSCQAVFWRRLQSRTCRAGGQEGDVIIVPAGISHRLLEDKDGDPFLMVGSYPNGKDWDMCYGKHGEESIINNIKDLPWFSKDPIYGDEGPVLSA
ncbi:hypothetical protein TrVFT333_008894 [Trichoderma virens FT-333]|nr:hypothetical protein TrVFT333_008894 [Trichoderma virens FT-333]